MAFREAVPRFWFLLAASVAALLAEIGLVLVARARLDAQTRAASRASAGDWGPVATLPHPSRLLEIIAVAFALILAVPFARTIQGARAALERTVTQTVAPEEKAAQAYGAITSDLDSSVMALLTLAVVATTASVAVGLGVSARRRAQGLRWAAGLAKEWPRSASAWLQFPGPDPAGVVGVIGTFLLCGVGPVAYAGWKALTLKMSALTALADAEGGEMGAILNRALDRASFTMDGGLAFACVGLVLAAIVTSILSRQLSPARARTRLIGDASRFAPEHGPVGILIACGAIIVSAAAFIGTGPMRRENASDWPLYFAGDRPAINIRTPNVDAPDRFDGMPVMHVTPRSLGLDGTDLDAASITSRLRPGRWRLRRPDDDHVSPPLLLVCEANTPARQLAVALRAAVDAGVPSVTFGFLSERTTVRPLFGRVRRYIPSGARTTVIEMDDDAPPGAAILDVGHFHSCEAISRSISNERWAGHDVALVLPAER